MLPRSRGSRRNPASRRSRYLTRKFLTNAAGNCLFFIFFFTKLTVWFTYVAGHHERLRAPSSTSRMTRRRPQPGPRTPYLSLNPGQRRRRSGTRMRPGTRLRIITTVTEVPVWTLKLNLLKVRRIPRRPRRRHSNKLHQHLQLLSRRYNHHQHKLQYLRHQCDRSSPELPPHHLKARIRYGSRRSLWPR